MKIKKIIWYVPLELNHSSYIYTSILEFVKEENCGFEISWINLNSKGTISFNDSKIIFSNNWYTKVCYVDIVLQNNKKIKLAFDLNDSGYVFSKEALETVDYFFKRTYINEVIKDLELNYKCKLVPMGMPFMVKPNELKNKLKLKFLFYKFRYYQLIKFDSMILKRIKNFYLLTNKDWIFFTKTRTSNDFKNKSLNNMWNFIFYQKRFFPYENSIDVKDIHNQRIRIIRLLKENFKNNFVGGLKKDSPITDGFEDCISQTEGNQLAFLTKMKSCGICVYTRGLSFSTGWTLPEFLSQGKCIVAERTNVVLPFSLENNINVLFYDNEDHLVSICNQLIKNKEMVDFVGKNALNYYNSYVSPSVFFNNILQKLND